MRHKRVLRQCFEAKKEEKNREACSSYFMSQNTSALPGCEIVRPSFSVKVMHTKGFRFKTKFERKREREKMKGEIRGK